MHTLKLVLEYDGTDFVGWQVQPNGRTVQEALERSLGTLLGGSIRVVGSGRTDAGVHARGQVVSFRTERDLPLRAYVHGLNALLPKDMAVVSAELAPEGFDARRSASGKRYVYRISTRQVRSPLRRRTHWEIFPPLDRGAMREAARHLLGEHDFSAFRASDCPAKTTVRILRVLDVRDGDDDEIVVVAEATAFLKHMVRNLVGTLAEVGLGRRTPDSLPALLASGDRTKAGRTAPPQGLALDEVFYEGR